MGEIEKIERALNDELIAIDCEYEEKCEFSDSFERLGFPNEISKKKGLVRNQAEIEKSVALESLLFDVIKKASPNDYSAAYVKKALNALVARL
jgi:hypothetical protein